MTNNLEIEITKHAAYMDSRELKEFLQKELQRLGELYLLIEKLEAFEKEFGVGGSNALSSKVEQLTKFLGRPEKKSFQNEKEYYNALDAWTESDAGKLEGIVSDVDLHIPLLDDIEETKEIIGKKVRVLQKALAAVQNSLKYTGPKDNVIEVKQENGNEEKQ